MVLLIPDHKPAWLIVCVVLLASSFCVSAQDGTPTLTIGQLPAAPVIDGIVNTDEWSGAAVTDTPFRQIQPLHGSEASLGTTVRIGQTDSALYFAFEATDPDPDRIATALTQRDSRLRQDDSVAMIIDTFGDGRTAYLFGTNTIGTQLDGRIADNGRTRDLRWDEAWRTASARTPDGWTIEIEIPFAILRYASADTADWGINLIRAIPRNLEISMWGQPSEDVFRVSSIGRLAAVQPPSPQDTWQFIPYALASIERGKGSDIEAGGDVRWRPSTRLGVDLTINPDFALVEADVEEINLSRFELQVPEKRPFFLEGNELYSQRIRQFYSRRIGDITWGAKTNGKIGNSDFSAIVTQEDFLRDDGLSSTIADYAVFRFQKSLTRGSNVGLLGANRNLDSDNAGSVGIDTTLFFNDTLGMTAQFLSVHGPNSDGGTAWFVRPAWDTSTSHFHVRYTNLDEGILDDVNAVGFLRDDNRKEVDTNFSHTFWFDDGFIENFEAGVNYNRYWGQDEVLRSYELDAELEVRFRNGWFAELNYIDEYKLFEKDFNNDRKTLEAGWDSRSGKVISAYVTEGFNFDEDLLLWGAEIEWPVGERLRLSYELARLELTSATTNEKSTIHVFDVNYFFNPDLFLKLFVQTNSAIEKENVQALWVWRFRPPFGALQVAYQRGTSDQGTQSDQADTLFAKFSWVF